MFQVSIARINRIEGKKQLRAYADIVINGEISINGIRLMDDSKGFWLGLPQAKYENKEGQTKYTTIVEMSESLKKQVKEAFLQAYNENQ